METTFYDENIHTVKKMKTSMTLDFDNFKPKIENEIFLNTPELASLIVATPEVEQLFNLNQSSMIFSTPTPTGQIQFPKQVTQEQEAYAKGFLEALGALHKNDTSKTNQILTFIPPAHTQNKTFTLIGQKNSSFSNQPSSQPLTYTNLLPKDTYPAVISTYNSDRSSPFVSTAIKKEFSGGSSYQLVPQNSPKQAATSSMIPINMDDQERAKLERKRERNRQAATRCRNRKLERIDRLEDRVKELKNQNAGLLKNTETLRSQVDSLKRSIAEHTKNGCQVMLTHPML